MTSVFLSMLLSKGYDATFQRIVLMEKFVTHSCYLISGSTYCSVSIQVHIRDTQWRDYMYIPFHSCSLYPRPLNEVLENCQVNFM